MGLWTWRPCGARLCRAFPRKKMQNESVCFPPENRHLSEKQVTPTEQAHRFRFYDANLNKLIGEGTLLKGLQICSDLYGGF